MVENESGLQTNRSQNKSEQISEQKNIFCRRLTAWLSSFFVLKMKNNKSRNLLKSLLSSLFFFVIFLVPITTFGADKVNVRMAFYADNQTLFNGNVTVLACDESPTNPTKTLNAMCAIDQVVSDQGWTTQKTYYSFGATLDSVNSYTPDFVNNKYWLYYTDKNPGEDALNKHILRDGENLEFVYNTNLIKLAGGDNALPGQTLNLSATYFDMFDWQRKPLTNSIFVINGVENNSTDGNFSILLGTNKNYSIYVKKDGYINSNEIKVNVEQNISSGASNSVNTKTENKKTVFKKEGVFDQKLAVDFLKRNLESKDASDFVLDWTAIALLANSQDKNIVKVAQDWVNKPIPEIKSATDLERVIMLKLGAKVFPWGERDLILELLRYFDGKQFGSDKLVNDDIFALIILNSTGFSEIEPEIPATINEILSFQQNDGSWNGVDMTSASIQALKPFEKDQRVQKSIEKAINFLKSSQKEDGGFGNPFSTAWAIQAIKTIGENPKDWQVKNKNPIDYLAFMQGDDGGISYLNRHEDRVWATAYALPAYTEKTWQEMFKVEEKWVGIGDRDKLREKFFAERAEAEKLALEKKEKEETKITKIETEIKNNNTLTASILNIDQSTTTKNQEEKTVSKKTGFFRSIWNKIFGK